MSFEFEIDEHATGQMIFDLFITLTHSHSCLVFISPVPLKLTEVKLR